MPRLNQIAPQDAPLYKFSEVIIAMLFVSKAGMAAYLYWLTEHAYTFLVSR